MMVGYGVVLVGVVGFVAGCFLPYFDPDYPGAPVPIRGVSIFQLQTVARSGVEYIGAILNLFAGVATFGSLALLGALRHAAWTTVALVAASAVWSLTWIGSLVGVMGTFEGFEGTGYWVMLASVGGVIVGAIIVLVSSRKRARERPPPISEPEPPGNV
jgi:hypothetical protein